MALRRTGIFGGSFDPVHLGHLIAAQDALEGLALDRVVFVPAAQAPLREGSPGIAAPARLELLRLAIAGDPGFEVSPIEIDRGGTSYSIETARALRVLWPDDRLFWIIGGDQAARLSQWRAIEELAGIVEFIVLERPGCAYDAPSVPGLRLHLVSAHAIQISSSDIRRRLSAGLPVHHFLPAAVARRLGREKLLP
jgi:nicotinate-nucleotide adenylyltransferase